MPSRREFLRQSAVLGAAAFPAAALAESPVRPPVRPAVLATWDNRAAAIAAWDALQSGAPALDAAEQGVWIPEADPNDRSVGLGGRPDRTGRVTLDIKGTEVTRDADEDNPAYRIEQCDGTEVLKSESELRRPS